MYPEIEINCGRKFLEIVARLYILWKLGVIESSDYFDMCRRIVVPESWGGQASIDQSDSDNF